MNAQHLVFLALAAALLALQTSPTYGQTRHHRISYSSQHSMEVNEPSDLIYHPPSAHFLVVSDNGYLAEVDAEGRLIRRSEQVGYDLEAICLVDGQLMIADELSRMFMRFTVDFERLDQREIPYQGGRNKAFEALAYLPDEQVFLALTERDPIWVFVLDMHLRILDRFELPLSARDISSARWYRGALWLLSDEDRTLFRCTYPDFRVSDSYLLPIVNPEGFAFDGSGRLVVCSDDLERLYTFPASLFTHGQ